MATAIESKQADRYESVQHAERVGHVRDCGQTGLDVIWPELTVEQQTKLLEHARHLRDPPRDFEQANAELHDVANEAELECSMDFEAASLWGLTLWGDPLQRRG